MANQDFGPFHYDPEQRVLFRDGNVVSLAPKAIDTLHVLLERRGRVIERAELMKLLWPDTTVEEIGLARNISTLRKAIEDDAGISYIETVPRRGYRFAAEPPSQPAPSMVGARRIPRFALVLALSVLIAILIYWQFYVPSKYVVLKPGTAALAVVPFESLTPRPDGATSAHEITDLLVADLSNAGGMEVLSPTTVRRHQRFGISMGLMGRILGLDVLVEGSVRRTGSRIQIATRLVDVHTGKIIWAKNYDRSSTDESGETEIAQDVASQIGARLASKRP